MAMLGLLAGCARFEPRPLAPAETAAALESRSLSNPELRSFLETNLHRVYPEWPLRSWDFPTLTLVAFYYHPSLDVARADWNLAAAGIRTAQQRPNPTVTASAGYEPVSDAPSPWIPALIFDLPIETASKRRLRTEQAQHLSEAARLNILSTAWQVRANLRASLLDYATARQRAALLQRQLDLQQQIVTLLEQRVQAGAIARNELTLPRVELAKSASDHADASRQAAEARVRIAEALGVSVKAMDDAQLDFKLAVSEDEGKELTTADARTAALLGRPDILAALATYAASQSALQLEIAKQYPDIHLDPGYSWNAGSTGEHDWTIGATVDLPVLNRNEGPIAEAKARREQAAAEFIALQAKVIAQIDSALAARATALDQLTRLGELARLSREQATAAEALYNAGAADKLDLASAQLEASANDLGYLDAQIKAQQAVAQLEDAIQRPVEAWPNVQQGRAPETQQVKP